MRLNLPVLLAASMALLFACTTPVTHGHIHEEEAVKSIKPGVTSREQVEQALGSPSSQSSFGLMTWYYVSSVKNVRSVLAPKIVQQDVIEIAFDGAGVVSDVKQYTLADGKKVDIVTRITPTEGQQLGFFEQIFANLGRFNKEGGSTPGRRPTAPPGR